METTYWIIEVEGSQSLEALLPKHKKYKDFQTAKKYKDEAEKKWRKNFFEDCNFRRIIDTYENYSNEKYIKQYIIIEFNKKYFIINIKMREQILRITE